MASDFNDHNKPHEKERKDERKKKREEGTQPAAQDRKCEEPAWVCFCGADKGRTCKPCQTEAWQHCHGDEKV